MAPAWGARRPRAARAQVGVADGGGGQASGGVVSRVRSAAGAGLPGGGGGLKRPRLAGPGQVPGGAGAGGTVAGAKAQGRPTSAPG